jgi:hypothetical protein
MSVFRGLPHRLKLSGVSYLVLYHGFIISILFVNRPQDLLNAQPLILGVLGRPHDFQELVNGGSQLSILGRALLAVYLLAFFINHQHLRDDQLHHVLGPDLLDEDTDEFHELVEGLLFYLPDLVLVIGQRPLEGGHDLVTDLQFLLQGAEDLTRKVH